MSHSLNWPMQWKYRRDARLSYLHKCTPQSHRMPLTHISSIIDLRMLDIFEDKMKPSSSESGPSKGIIMTMATSYTTTMTRKMAITNQNQQLKHTSSHSENRRQWRRHPCLNWCFKLNSERAQRIQFKKIQISWSLVGFIATATKTTMTTVEAISLL